MKLNIAKHLSVGSTKAAQAGITKLAPVDAQSLPIQVSVNVIVQEIPYRVIAQTYLRYSVRSEYLHSLFQAPRYLLILHSNTKRKLAQAEVLLNR